MDNFITRDQLCHAMAQEYAMKMTPNQTKKFANALGKKMSDKSIFKHFEKIGISLVRLSGGRYYLQSQFS